MHACCYESTRLANQYFNWRNTDELMLSNFSKLQALSLILLSLIQAVRAQPIIIRETPISTTTAIPIATKKGPSGASDGMAEIIRAVGTDVVLSEGNGRCVGDGVVSMNILDTAFRYADTSGALLISKSVLTALICLAAIFAASKSSAINCVTWLCWSGIGRG